MASASPEKDFEETVHIPSVTTGEHYEVKIENVYDPSKFWVIVQFRELAIFMKYLKMFYDNVENRKTLERNIFKKELMYLVHRNDFYYRASMLPAMLPDQNQIRVFLLDFGYIVNVALDDVFYIHEKHKQVPRFAVRSSLAYISPADQSNTWTQTDLKFFCALIASTRLVAKICAIDKQRGILFIEIYILSGKYNESVNSILVAENVAKLNKFCVKSDTTFTKYKSLVKYPHLFPSFEALESGAVPCSLWEKDLLVHSLPVDILYKDYFQYQSCY